MKAAGRVRKKATGGGQHQGKMRVEDGSKGRRVEGSNKGGEDEEGNKGRRVEGGNKRGG